MRSKSRIEKTFWQKKYFKFALLGSLLGSIIYFIFVVIFRTLFEATKGVDPFIWGVFYLLFTKIYLAPLLNLTITLFLIFREFKSSQLDSLVLLTNFISYLVLLLIIPVILLFLFFIFELVIISVTLPFGLN